MTYLSAKELEIRIQSFNFYQSDFREEDYDYGYQDAVQQALLQKRMKERDPASGKAEYNAEQDRIWETYSYCLFTGGVAHLKIADREYHFRKGDLCFYKPGQINTQYYDTQYTCYHIRLSVYKKDSGEPLEFNEKYTCFLDRIPTFSQSETLSEIRQASLDYDRCSADSEEGHLMRKLCTDRIVLALYKLYQPENDRIFYHPAVKKAITYFHQNLDLPLSMEKIAKIVGLSEKYFQKVFKESTGLTPNEYLTRRRLYIAEKKLLTTNMPIADIAFESGFSSTTYFGYVFKKHYHFTPTQYRKLL